MTIGWNKSDMCMHLCSFLEGKRSLASMHVLLALINNDLQGNIFSPFYSSGCLPEAMRALLSPSLTRVNQICQALSQSIKTHNLCVPINNSQVVGLPIKLTPSWGWPSWGIARWSSCWVGQCHISYPAGGHVTTGCHCTIVKAKC